MCRSEKLFLLREKFIDSLQFVYPMQFPNISLFKFLTRLTMLEDKTASSHLLEYQIRSTDDNIHIKISLVNAISKTIVIIGL